MSLDMFVYMHTINIKKNKLQTVYKPHTKQIQTMSLFYGQCGSSRNDTPKNISLQPHVAVKYFISLLPRGTPKCISIIGGDPMYIALRSDQCMLGQGHKVSLQGHPKWGALSAGWQNSCLVKLDRPYVWGLHEGMVLPRVTHTSP